MNNVILIGRLTRDADIRWSQGQDQKCVARFTLAVDRRFKQEGAVNADFISCISFGKTAEFLEKYGKKGTKFAAVGRIQTGSYEKEGQKVYTTDVVVDSLEFTESKKDGGSAAEPQPDADGWMNVPDGIDEELPFN